MLLPNTKTSNNLRNRSHQSIFQGWLDSSPHKELKPGLLRHLIIAAGLAVEDFEKLLL